MGKHRRRSPCCEDEARRYLATLDANPAPAGLDFAPPLPEVDCPCSACAYLTRKQAEAYSARLATARQREGAGE